MHNTHSTSKRKGHIATIEFPSFFDEYKGIRKAPVRAGQTHRDKRNDYKRKEKFHKGWD